MIIQMNPKCTFYNWCYIILNHHRKGGGFMRQNKYNDINIQLDKINQEVNNLDNKSYIIVFKNILKLLEDIIVYINLRE